MIWRLIGARVSLAELRFGSFVREPLRVSIYCSAVDVGVEVLIIDWGTVGEGG